MPDESTDVLVYPVRSAAPPDLQKQLSDMANEMARQLAMIRELQDTKADEGGELDTGFAQPGLDMIVVPDGDISGFRYEWKTDRKTITVYEGHIAIAGRGAWEVAEGDVALTGATAFVYVTQDRGSLSTVAVSPTTLTTYPEATAGEYRWAIWKFTSSDGGTTYDPSRSCREDIRLGTPP